MSQYDYDLIVLGGGSAGLTAASLSAGFGKRTLLVDKSKLGGECTWSGCIPSKTILKSACVAHEISDLTKYGIKIGASSKPKINCDSVLKSVRDIREKVYNSEKPSVFEKLGIKVLEGKEVKFINQNTLKVGKDKITADKFIIATGSSPMVPPIEGLDQVAYQTNETIFNMKKLPKDMVVMGGGPIGIELAFAFNRLGVKVTVIEMFSKILIREDFEMSGLILKKLESEGIKVITGAKIVKVEGKAKKRVSYELKGKILSVQTDELLVAAGRKANMYGFGLEDLGVKFSRNGIKVNNRMQTSVKNIYACGDVAGPYQFSHMAGYQAAIAGQNALLPGFLFFLKPKVNYKNVPWITFTDPELARSGLTEEEAAVKYKKNFKVFKQTYEYVDRAVTERSTSGIAKVICKKNGQILGIHIAGERAGEMMQELHLAKTMGIPLFKLQSVLHAYPAYSDILKKLAKDAYIFKIQNNPIVRLISFFRGKR